MLPEPRSKAERIRAMLENMSAGLAPFIKGSRLPKPGGCCTV
jgi:hypothetical protein